MGSQAACLPTTKRVSDMPVSDGKRRHDSLCRPASRDVLTNRMGCDCELIARVRKDERAAALRDAVEAVKALNNEKALIIDEWTTVEAVAAIRGLGGE